MPSQFVWSRIVQVCNVLIIYYNIHRPEKTSPWPYWLIRQWQYVSDASGWDMTHWGFEIKTNGEPHAPGDYCTTIFFKRELTLLLWKQQVTTVRRIASNLRIFCHFGVLSAKNSSVGLQHEQAPRVASNCANGVQLPPLFLLFLLIHRSLHASIWLMGFIRFLLPSTHGNTAFASSSSTPGEFFFSASLIYLVATSSSFLLCFCEIETLRVCNLLF